MPGGAPYRAGDREAENPEAPPCEDGLSAASAKDAGEPPPQATASGFPDAALASPPDHRQRCRPTSRRLMSAPLCRAGWMDVRTIHERLSRTLFTSPERDGSSRAGARPGEGPPFAADPAQASAL